MINSSTLSIPSEQEIELSVSVADALQRVHITISKFIYIYRFHSSLTIVKL